MHSAALCTVCAASSFPQALGRTSRLALKIHLSATFLTFSEQI